MKIIIKTSEDFCDCNSCINLLFDKIKKDIKFGLMKGELRDEFNEKADWELK